MVDRGRLGLALDYAKKLGVVNPCIRYPSAPSTKAQPLSESFEPGNWDVICQGGKESYDHIGNRRFRICIDNNLRTYSEAKSKHERSLVVTCIVDVIREMGSFVRKDELSGRWLEVDDKTAREKVGHALRDAIKALTKEQQHKKHSGSDAASQASASKRRRVMELAPATVPSCSKPLRGMNQPLHQGTVDVASLSGLPVDSNKKPPLFCFTTSLSAGSQETDAGDNHSDAGDSVLNEMAQETMLDEVTTIPAVNSLPFNPPGFSSFEEEYMNFYRQLGPLRSPLQSQNTNFFTEGFNSSSRFTSSELNSLTTSFTGSMKEGSENLVGGGPSIVSDGGD